MNGGSSILTFQHKYPQHVFGKVIRDIDGLAGGDFRPSVRITYETR